MAFSRARSLRWMGTIALFVSLAGASFAADLHVKVPKRTKPTPVQKLNADGVRAIEKHDYKRAKKLFYQAYLLDPDDPFTLNNLGYMAELDGEIDRAQRYYALAADQNSEAVVSTATTEQAKGKAVGLVAGSAAGYEADGFALCLFGGRGGNDGFGILIGSQSIVALRTVDFTV